MVAVSDHRRSLRNDLFQVRLQTQQCKAELHALEARAAALKAEEHEKLHMLAAQDNFIVQKSSELYSLDQQLQQKRKELADMCAVHEWKCMGNSKKCIWNCQSLKL